MNQPEQLKIIANVAISSTGYGIRLRASRNGRSVWMAEGWPEHAPEGAMASPQGYRWPDAEAAQKFLDQFIKENAEHGYEESVTPKVERTENV